MKLGIVTEALQNGKKTQEHVDQTQEHVDPSVMKQGLFLHNS